MNWAKTSWLKNGSYGIDSLLAFDCFVPKDLFDTTKSFFQGYIQKDGKKLAVYTTQVINALLEKGQQVELDGISITKEALNSGKSLLLLCENCTNEKVAKLAKLYKEELKEKEFSEGVNKTVNEIFGKKYFKQLSKGISVPEDIKWETYKINDKEYKIDFNYGVECSEDWEETSHEAFNKRLTYRVIPDKSKLEELKNLLEESQLFCKNLDANESAEWMPGFDGSSHESRKKNIT